MGFMSEWGRELESCVPHFSLPLPPPPPVPGIWGGVTCDPDADRRAFLRSVARVGGHAAVDALILVPYLREVQHRAGGTGQGCTLVGKRGRKLLDTPPTNPGLLISTATHSVSQAPSNTISWLRAKAFETRSQGVSLPSCKSIGQRNKNACNCI